MWQVCLRQKQIALRYPDKYKTTSGWNQSTALQWGEQGRRKQLGLSFSCMLPAPALLSQGSSPLFLSHLIPNKFKLTQENPLALLSFIPTFNLGLVKHWMWKTQTTWWKWESSRLVWSLGIEEKESNYNCNKSLLVELTGGWKIVTFCSWQTHKRKVNPAVVWTRTKSEP